MSQKSRLKGILLSVFVFPGMGQIYLGQKKKGQLIILILGILFLVFIFHISILAAEIVDEIQLQINPSQLLPATQEALDHFMTKHGGKVSAYLFGFLGIYAISAFDIIFSSRRDQI